MRNRNLNYHKLHTLPCCGHTLSAFLLAATAAIVLALSLPAAVKAQGRTGLVLAFYYAWYNEGSFGPGKTAFQPQQPYNSGDPAVIQRQVNQARAAGIDGFVQSWYGPGEGVTNGNLQTLLDVAAASGFKVAVDFEPATFLGSHDERASALRSLLATHATHPAYLRVDGKPVIFFWANWAYSVDDWAYIRSIADPDHQSIWIAEGARTEYLSVFDGLHLYNIAWSANPNGIASTWAANTRAAAENYGAYKYWVATAMPGFDDRHLGRGEASVYRDRAAGAYYQNSFAAAAASGPDMLIITSFNEWAEGSNIEPSVSFGETYLDLTAQLVSGYKSGGVAPPPPLPQPTPTSQTSDDGLEDIPPGDDGTEDPPPDDDPQALAQAATSTPQPTVPAFASPTAQADGRIIYEVVEGDTLSAIASRFGIELSELYALNDLNDNSLLRIGQTLVLGSEDRSGDLGDVPQPLPPGVELGEDGNLIYEVQEDDTLLAIAVRYDLSLEELLAFNPAISEDSLLQLGQQIVVGQRRQPESVGGSTDIPEGTGTATPAAQQVVATSTSTPVMLPTETRRVATATATQAIAADGPVGTPSQNDGVEGTTRDAVPIAERSTPTWLMVVIVFVVISGASGITLLILGARKSADRESR